ncbi:MAG TPA: fibronectin type III domain-containing protein [Candidatus Paceibacterota bacterium]|nr:fibronectin type III domain-containing protein [Candidatus Paceibacterota bacterium]HPT17924.1 fibronectin type III domain-containing protein [Candidatus Paceibacterota bacterium]
MKINIKKIIFVVFFVGIFVISNNYSFATEIQTTDASKEVSTSFSYSSTIKNSYTDKTSESNPALSASSQKNILTNGSPSIVYTFADQVTETGAILNGSVNPNGYHTEAWYHMGPPITPPLQLQSIGDGNSPVHLASYTLTNLIPNTTYNFRIEASNIKGTTYGGWTSFKTLDTTVAPVLDSVSPSSSDKGKTFNIVLTGNYFNPSTVVNFSGTGITVNSRSVDSITSITATITISDSANSGEYNVTVSNNNGTSNAKKFTVNSSGGGGGGGGGGSGSSVHYVLVNTSNISNVTKSSAMLAGTINPKNTNAKAWFEYGTSPYLYTFNETTHRTIGSENSYQSFSEGISNLNPNTTYYFRAAGSNSVGTRRGSILSFTTTGNGNIVIEDDKTKNIVYPNKNIENYVEETTEDDINTNNAYFPISNNLTASSLFAFENILPNTISGWIFLIILIAIIFIISRKLYLEHKEKKSLEKIDANNIENLPIE